MATNTTRIEEGVVYDLIVERINAIAKSIAYSTETESPNHWQKGKTPWQRFDTWSVLSIKEDATKLHKLSVLLRKLDQADITPEAAKAQHDYLVRR